MQSMAGMFLLGSLGFPELLFIVFIILIFFGGKRLGDIGKGFGEGIRNFRTAVKKDDKPTEDDKNQKPTA